MRRKCLNDALSAVCIIAHSAQRLGYGLNSRGIGVLFPGRLEMFSAYVQTGCGVHLDSYTRAVGLFPGDEVVRA